MKTTTFCRRLASSFLCLLLLTTCSDDDQVVPQNDIVTFLTYFNSASEISPRRLLAPAESMLERSSDGDFMVASAYIQVVENGNANCLDFPLECLATRSSIDFFSASGLSIGKLTTNFYPSSLEATCVTKNGNGGQVTAMLEGDLTRVWAGDENDLLSDWSTIINGKVYQIENRDQKIYVLSRTEGFSELHVLSSVDGSIERSLQVEQTQFQSQRFASRFAISKNGGVCFTAIQHIDGRYESISINVMDAEEQPVFTRQLIVPDDARIMDVELLEDDSVILIYSVVNQFEGSVTEIYTVKIDNDELIELDYEDFPEGDLAYAMAEITQEQDIILYKAHDREDSFGNRAYLLEMKKINPETANIYWIKGPADYHETFSKIGFISMLIDNDGGIVLSGPVRDQSALAKLDSNGEM